MIEFVPLHIRLLVKRLAILIIPYELCRIVFRIFSAAYFSGLGFSKLCYYLYVGLRYDISAILLSNLLFIVLSLLPFGSEQSIYRRVVLKMVFLVTNSVAFLLEIGDTIFFQFIFRRSTGDLFKFLSLGDDSVNLLPSLLKDYWYMLLLWIAIIVFMFILYDLTGKRMFIKASPAGSGKILKIPTVAAYVVTLVLITLGCRGGWQLKPLDIRDAINYASPHDVPLVLNTPFTIITTIGKPMLEEKKLLTEQVAAQYYSPRHAPFKGSFRKYNVVTIIMESLSKEYIGALNNRHRTCTPFLDSLITQSLVCDNAFSDGKKSIEGIPAVVASMPSWMNNAFIISDYSGDHINCLAALLGKEGYTTAFFHGGHNGTMGFDKFCPKAGFRYYYGKTEYNNDADYDGNWGIWDEPYFQYFARNMDTLHQPFYAAIFSISSHDPFSIPPKYKTRFVHKDGELLINACVQYSDLSLREFFQTASKMPWFDSTLFVITADHAGPSNDPYFSNRLGLFEIPIIFYKHNSGLKGVSHVTANQIDILPSVLDYLQYPKPYYSFGTSIFDTSATANHFALNYLSDVYQVVKSPYCMQMVGDTIFAMYNYRKDSMLQNNLIMSPLKAKDSLTYLMKAVIQTYSNSLIHNKM